MLLTLLAELGARQHKLIVTFGKTLTEEDLISMELTIFSKNVHKFTSVKFNKDKDAALDAASKEVLVKILKDF